MIKDILWSDRHMSRLNEEEKSKLAFLQSGKARESQRYTFLLRCMHNILLVQWDVA